MGRAGGGPSVAEGTGGPRAAGVQRRLIGQRPHCGGVGNPAAGRKVKDGVDSNLAAVSPP